MWPDIGNAPNQSKESIFTPVEKERVITPLNYGSFIPGKGLLNSQIIKRRLSPKVSVADKIDLKEKIQKVV